jgi:Transglycosylase SLT domain
MPELGSRTGRHRYVHPSLQAAAPLDGGSDEPILAPGIAAMLRRHPRAVRNGAAGSMLAGVALFVVASLIATAGAQPAKLPVAAPPPAPAQAYAPLPDPAASVASAVPSVPQHAKHPAPSDPSAISGLEANGIPTVALNAYRVAAARLASADPGCGIDWALLAGIGRVESDHGRFGGAVLHANGISTPRIIGIALDGHGTALIWDTDHGVLDGDTVYDHAVGPMQFIPSTWRAYGTDADGDGVANVFDVNDAALTAARYLCAAGGDLRTHDGQVRAVLAYNASDQYLAEVLALADAYRRGIPISGVPIGATTGPLPPVSPGAVPPANPGAPLAAPSGTSAPSATSGSNSTSTHSSAPTPAPSGSTGSTSTGGSGGSVGGTSPTVIPTPTPTTSTPTPSPTRVCVLTDLFGHCLLWKT